MTRIRYIAILSGEPRALASYYRSTFGMCDLGESAAGDMSITDGYINLTIFKIRGDLGEARMEPGLHHLGIEVDNLEPSKARFRKHNPRGVMVPEMPGIHYGDLRLYDPESIPVSLSRRSFGMTQINQGLPRFGHVGFDVLDPDAMADFYSGVFGFKAAPVSDADADAKRPDRSVNDGAVNLEFHCYFGKRAAHEPRYGINHLGLLVDDAAKVAQRIPGATLIPASTGASNAYAAQDPDGNQLRIVQASGSGADLERWSRVA
jgi:catechol 2,3-dioxygenase-like lactoylglutathione lyase family enzyme